MSFRSVRAYEEACANVQRAFASLLLPRSQPRTVAYLAPSPALYHSMGLYVLCLTERSETDCMGDFCKSDCLLLLAPPAVYVKALEKRGERKRDICGEARAASTSTRDFSSCLLTSAVVSALENGRDRHVDSIVQDDRVSLPVFVYSAMPLEMLLEQGYLLALLAKERLVIALRERGFSS